MGIYIACVPFDERDAMYAMFRANGLECELAFSGIDTHGWIARCVEGAAAVELKISQTSITIFDEETQTRVKVERAFAIRRRRISERTRTQRREDDKLFQKIQRLLEPFEKAEREIEKTAWLSSSTGPENTRELLKRWNRRHRDC